MVEDWDAYLADFGIDVSIAGQAARAIFRRPYAEMMGVSSSSPVLGLPTSRAAQAVQGTAVTVPGQSPMRIRSAEPDGTGWTVLQLELA